jgi:hypothetical protein
MCEERKQDDDDAMLKKKAKRAIKTGHPTFKHGDTYRLAKDPNSIVDMWSLQFDRLRRTPS